MWAKDETAVEKDSPQTAVEKDSPQTLDLHTSFLQTRSLNLRYPSCPFRIEPALPFETFQPQRNSEAPEHDEDRFRRLKTRIVN